MQHIAPAMIVDVRTRLEHHARHLFVERRLFWILLVVGLIADLWSKAWAQGAVMPEGWELGHYTPSIPVIEGVFAWKWAANIGAAFSILSGQTTLLAVIGIAALIGVFWYVYQTPTDQRMLLVGLGLVGSGAIGNVADRIQFGWVRDFMYFDFDLPFHESVSFIPKRYPVFNVADIAILGGVILMLVALSRMKEPEKPAKA